MNRRNLVVIKRSLNPLRLFNSVPFGILLMVLVAAYIAVGSGRPWLREYGVDQIPGFRSWFDLTDLQFFDAWPLKLLMAMLIVNLVVVTWIRIPLTPPRYGVWCVHIGIITLILGTSFYYNRKVEGRVRLFTSVNGGAVSTDHFYDKDERSLYLKVNDTPWNWYPLVNLPLFNEYDASLGNDGALNRRGLRHILPTVAMHDASTSNQTVSKTLSQWLGWNKDVSFDVISYFPYASTNTDFAEDPASNTTGVHMTVPDMHEGRDVEAWAVSADPRYKQISQFGDEFEHRPADATLLPALLQSANQLFHFDVTIQRPAGQPAYTQSLFVQPGKIYPLGDTGYTLSLENFDPAWSMFGTHETVQALTMKVVSPTQTFRRMVLDGKDVQTDFVLNAAGAGPMGKRQKAPLDGALRIKFKFADPYGLLPQQGGTEKHTLITPLEKAGLIDVVAADNAATTIHQFDSGVGDVDLAPPQDEQQPPFAAAAGAGAPSEAPAAPAHPSVRLHLERQDHLRRDDSVQSIPPSQRDRNVEESGAAQAIKVLVHYGDWSQVVVVPFTDEAGDMPWDGGTVTLPGTSTTLQLQLGQTRRTLPATVTLDKFDLVPYPGGDVNNPRTLMRDFRSTLTVDDPAGDRITDVAHMNHPVYFHNDDWLLFQAAYDGQNRTWTQLGVGNRPGVRVMVTGCLLIFAGLAYAFYAKPVIIRRMKEKALANALATGKRPKSPVSVPRPAEAEVEEVLIS